MFALLALLLSACTPSCTPQPTTPPEEDSEVSYYSADYAARAAVTSIKDSPTQDLTIVIPPDWDPFWTTIDDDGYGIRLTEANGLTVVDYQVSSFTKATRTMELEVDDLVMGGSAVLLWLYYDTDTPTDGAATFTATTPVATNYIHLGEPTGWILELRPDAPGQATPSQQIGKTEDDEILLWWKCVTLEPRSAPYNTSTAYEEVYAVVTAYVLSSGTPDGTMTDNSKLRIVQGNDGFTYVRMLVKGGTSGTDYTVSITIETTVGSLATGDQANRTINGRALLKVLDPSE